MDCMEYKNRAELKVTACGETHIICSNEVSAKKVVVRVVKEQNKQCVFEGDCLQYTIKICNDSPVVIYDPIFCDDLPDGLKYVDCSFCVDGKPENPAVSGNLLTYKLKKLAPCSETCITFATHVR